MDVRTAGEEALNNKLVAVIEAARAGGDVAARFAHRLFEALAPDDIAAAPASDRAAQARALFAFMRQREPEATKLRIYDPTPEADGYSSRYTVVEIINDDMPFLVDSVRMEFVRRDLAVHLMAHPVMPVARDAAGVLTEFGGPARGAPRESMMRIEIDRIADAAGRDDLAAALRQALGEVRLAVADWFAMRQAALDAVGELAVASGRMPALRGPLEEAATFLRWVEANHFTFLGFRRFKYGGGKRGPVSYDVVPGSGLGILRGDEERLFNPHPQGRAALASFAASSSPVLVLKSDRPSRVHRAGAMDVIAVKIFDAKGKVTGERRFAGLFTSSAYHASPRDIPLLRRKVEAVIDRAGYDPASHDGKALINIIETHPRDELFQADEDTLFATATGVLQLQERQRVALFARPDAAGRFVSCLVYAPRDSYDTDLRRRFAAILERAYRGTVDSFSVNVGDESVLARVLFILRPADPMARLPDPIAVERELAEAARTWGDKLKAALVERHGEADGLGLARRMATAFPVAYREMFDGVAAARDLTQALSIQGGVPLGIDLYRRSGQAPHQMAVKLMRAGQPIPLSDILPPLEAMGLRVMTETPFRLSLPDGAVWLHDFSIETADGRAVDVDAERAGFAETLGAVWTGDMESDGFNRLVLGAEIEARDVVVLRAYAKFLRQAGFPFSQDYIERALAAHLDIAADLAALFRARLDPALGAADSPERQERIEKTRMSIAAALEQVASLDEDRILRRYLNAIECTLRTNFWQTGADGRLKSYVSFKLDSRHLDELPLPRPMVEIFVYSPRVEGVHLRGGPVARGGIRWSDRREDFRTEILGLMKAQMVKNAVIVPVGSKGGFYVKRPPVGGTRDQIQSEGIECYKTLVRGMLDITDNLNADGKVVPPSGVLRHDGDDPYLVVAADKGTATFSDIANGVSAEYGFWLADAFASGGSVGYDHKKMGITARGAWESVKRHFRELGLDTQTTPFTAVGVGDMSGDVFGNGMLRSDKTRLVAAFDHRHIFVDPDPDPAASFAERQRLFDLPRSSWADYDRAKLSAGGFIVERGAKSVAVTPEARAVLDIESSQVAPNDLMRAILKAPVDLLFFGGIGNYVKASAEAHADAGDKANDTLRIDGRDVRARVIGEGANLGVTQRGRIEAAQAGVRINTDAMDNSAGVDTSDHEVNIKVALGDAVRRQALGAQARDQLLASMTDEVGNLVLRHNYQQTQAVSVAAVQAIAMHERHARMMRALERANRLDRTVEFLPDNDTMKRRAAAGQPLTRPELCVLLAYGKIVVNDEILASDLPDDPLLEAELLRYFPLAMREGFSDSIRRHRLRREIVALQVTNSMVNRVGSTFVHDIRDRTGASTADIARCFAIVRDSFLLRDLWAEIEALDSQLVAPAQIAMLIATQRLIERGTLWALRGLPRPVDLTRAVDALRPAVATMAAELDTLLPQGERAAIAERAGTFIQAGVPEELAHRIAALDTLAASGDIAALSAIARVPVGDAARLYFDLGARLGFDWLRAAADRLPRETHWQMMAGNAVVDDFATVQRSLAASALAGAPTDAAAIDVSGLLDAWTAPRREALERVDRVVVDLKSQPTVDLAMLTVAANELRGLATV
ncbi:NAD-glutamate dehydrogenase [Vineibacter terrae]|uniref:NAD-glutamate dehydrogenase n=1 Tax=Vineibacter terrae TaxID=2586908 RepID=UPI002E351F1F|nr:NAD-glutamate dehydrogenase [Vineibacter terrae]HEX2888739.1 NAD-glutamate dehydrogenase [Vineibacter terrae]